MTWDWNWFTPLGHVAVVWPLMIATGALVLARRDGAQSARAILIWMLSMAAASFLVAASKVAFYGWGTGIREWNLSCFSGHSALAMGFWPIALALLVPTQYPRVRVAAWGAGAMIGLLVGISRMKLHAHPGSEVAAGLTIGMLVAAIHRGAMGDVMLRARNTAIAAALLSLSWALSGAHLPNVPTEQWLASLGAALAENEEPLHRDAWARGRNESKSKDAGQLRSTAPTKQASHVQTSEDRARSVAPQLPASMHKIP